jgi:hypothetical protein
VCADILHAAVRAYLFAICALVNCADAVPTLSPPWASRDLASMCNRILDSTRNTRALMIAGAAPASPPETSFASVANGWQRAKPDTASIQPKPCTLSRSVPYSRAAGRTTLGHAPIRCPPTSSHSGDGRLASPPCRMRGRTEPHRAARTRTMSRRPHIWRRCGCAASDHPASGVLALLLHGADPSDVDAHGNSALHFCMVRAVPCRVQC